MYHWYSWENIFCVCNCFKFFILVHYFFSCSSFPDLSGFIWTFPTILFHPFYWNIKFTFKIFILVIVWEFAMNTFNYVNLQITLYYFTCNFIPEYSQFFLPIPPDIAWNIFHLFVSYNNTMHCHYCYFKVIF